MTLLMNPLSYLITLFTSVYSGIKSVTEFMIIIWAQWEFIITTGIPNVDEYDTINDKLIEKIPGMSY